MEFSLRFSASIQLAFCRCHYHFDDDNNVCLECNFNVIFMLIEICAMAQCRRGRSSGRLYHSLRTNSDACSFVYIFAVNSTKTQ